MLSFTDLKLRTISRQCAPSLDYYTVYSATFHGRVFYMQIRQIVKSLQTTE